MKPVAPGCSFDDLPLALRPAEVAAYLRVSPSTVYALIRELRATDGVSGLPAYRLALT